MIIIRYLVREIFKSQIAILFILLLIFFSQKLVRILSATVSGDIPTSLILSLLAFGLPAMAQLILPLSLFLGILMTLGKLYTESEITVMHACGLGKRVLIIAVLILACLTSIFSAINTIWLGPWSAKNQDKALAEAKANPSVAALVEGQFQVYQDGNAVLFVNSVSNQQFNRVFMAQLRPDGHRRPSVVVADRGQIRERPDGSKIVLFNKGTRYEGTALLRDFRITDFTDYQAVIGHQRVTIDTNKAEQMSVNNLWRSTEPYVRAEFHWRLTLIFSVIVMALLAVPLSVVNPRQGRVLSMLPAMLLYLIFFLLQSTLRSNADDNKLDPLIWMWLANGVYLALAIVLNLWDSLPIRKLRLHFRGMA